MILTVSADDVHVGDRMVRDDFLVTVIAMKRCAPFITFVFRQELDVRATKQFLIYRRDQPSEGDSN